MVDTLAGLTLLGLVAALAAVGSRAARGGRTGMALACVVVGGLALGGFSAGDRRLHNWDERVHALVAKNLSAHPLRPTLYDDPVLPYDYRDWLANHVWLHKPPLALWLMAASLRLFGVNEIAVRLPSLLASTGAVLLTYLLGAWLFTRQTGLLAAAFQATNGLLIDLAAGRAPTDHVDAIFVAAVELAVVLGALHARTGSNRWLVACGVAVGLALLTKWLPALVAVAVWAFLARRRFAWRALAPRAVALLAIATAVALPWQIHVRRAFPDEAAWEAAYNLRHLVQPLEGHAHGPLYYIERSPRTFGEAALPALLWLAVILLRGRAHPALRALATWVWLPWVVFSLVATKMPAYVIVAAPAVALVQAHFWWWLKERWKGPRPAWASALLGLLLLLPLRFALERAKPFGGFAREARYVGLLRSLPERLGAGPTVIFSAPDPIRTMFYTPYTAYPFAPDLATAREIQERGYRVAAFDDGTLPEATRAIPGLLRIPCPPWDLDL